MTTICFDIETLPDMRPGARDAFIAESRANFKAPSSLTKEQAAVDLGMTDASEIKFTSKDNMLRLWEQRFAAEKADEVGDQQWRKTSFDGAHGMICCIGAAFDDDKPMSCWNPDYAQHEATILREFFASLEGFRVKHHMARPVFVGHNISGFDIRFVYQRAIINHVPVPLWWPINARPWDDVMFDTMVQWAGFKDRISLDGLCSALGIEGKTGMDGSMVCDAVLDGRIAEVAEYCEHDVLITRECYKRMTYRG